MRQSGLGIASLILGIIGLLFSMIFIGIFPCVISLILAIVVIANKNVKHSLAVAGCICSVIGISVFVLLYGRNFLPTSEKEPQQLSFNETYNIDDMFEFTPIEGRLAAVVLPSNQQGEWTDIYDWIMGDDDELPYELIAMIKNIGSEEINLRSTIDAEIVINDIYKFDAEIKMENKEGNEFENEDLKPLQERKYHIYSFVPEEVWSICESCVVNLAFPDDYTWSADLEDAQVQIYTIEFDKNKIDNDLSNN